MEFLHKCVLLTVRRFFTYVKKPVVKIIHGYGEYTNDVMRNASYEAYCTKAIKIKQIQNLNWLYCIIANKFNYDADEYCSTNDKGQFSIGLTFGKRSNTSGNSEIKTTADYVIEDDEYLALKPLTIDCCKAFVEKSLELHSYVVKVALSEGYEVGFDIHPAHANQKIVNKNIRIREYSFVHYVGDDEKLIHAPNAIIERSWTNREEFKQLSDYMEKYGIDLSLTAPGKVRYSLLHLEQRKDV